MTLHKDAIPELFHQNHSQYRHGQPEEVLSQHWPHQQNTHAKRVCPLRQPLSRRSWSQLLTESDTLQKLNLIISAPRSVSPPIQTFTVSRLGFT